MIFYFKKKQWWKDLPKEEYVVLPRKTITGEWVVCQTVYRFIDLWDDYGVEYGFALNLGDIPDDKKQWNGPR